LCCIFESSDNKGGNAANFKTMSVHSQIKKDWEQAIKIAQGRSGDLDRTGKVQIAIESGTGDEYFVRSEDLERKTIRVYRKGIDCDVYKRGYSLRWVPENYELRPLKTYFK
jgi:hypothetical protein